MRIFLAGLLVGALVGGGGVYVTLSRPWDDGANVQAEPPADAGTVADKKSGKRKNRRGRRRRKAGSDAPVDDITVLSPGQKRLVWRGARVALPPRSIDFDGEGAGRALNQGEINSGVSAVRDGVVRCIGDSRRNAEIVATITVKFLVSSAGRVTASRVRGPAFLHENGLLRCVRRALRSARFPATGAATVVTVPFELT